MEGPVPRRGDIFYADLNPVVGSEQGGKRPVLIIQNDQGNKHSPTVIVAPLTSKPKGPGCSHAKGTISRPQRITHVLLPKEKVHRLREDSIVMLEQIRTLDKKRLDEEKTGRVSQEIMDIIDEAIVKSVDLEPYIKNFLKNKRDSLLMTNT